MATQRMTIEDVCTELVQWRLFRRDGLTPDEAAVLMGLSPSTAGHYERTVLALTALKSEMAPDAPGAASDPTKGITS